MNEQIEVLLTLLRLYAHCSVKTVKEQLLPVMDKMYGAIVAGSELNVLTPEEVRAGQFEGKIACIKLHRSRTQCGLKESKDAVENYFARNRIDFRNY